MKNDLALLLIKRSFSLPKDDLWRGRLTQLFWNRTLSKFCRCIFPILLLSYLAKRQGPLFEQTWIIFNEELCQVRLKLTLWFGKRFLNFVNVFSTFCYFIPLQKDSTLYLNNNDEWQRTNFHQKSSLYSLIHVSAERRSKFAALHR